MVNGEYMNRLWNDRSITFKYSAGICLLLFLMLIVALTGYLSLHQVRNAQYFIQVSTEIQRLVYEMDRDMEKARNLHSDFFLYYPKVGLGVAHEIYAQPSIRNSARVVSTSRQLREMIATEEASKALKESNIDLNLYLSSAKRFADTSIESFELVTRLAKPGDGLEARLENTLKELLAELELEWEMASIVHGMQLRVLEYQEKRERFLMQTAFNMGFRLRMIVKESAGLDSVHKEKAYRLLDSMKEIAEEILLVDVMIAAKFKDFKLQKEAADDVSEHLIILAKYEVGKAKEKIAETYDLSFLILTAITLLGFFLSVAIAFILNTNITLRILRLTDTAEKLREGQLDVVAESSNSDELGKLGKSFNFMSERLRNLVRNLEGEVQDRTRKIIETNTSLQREITERKHAELRFRMAAEAMSDVIYEWNPDDDSLVWFGSTDSPAGQSVQDFPRSIDEWLKRIHPDDRHRLARATEHHRTATDPINHEYRIQGRDGTWYHWLDCGLPVLADGHSPHKWVGVCKDITAQKQAEQDKQKLEEQLRQSHKMEAIGTLAGGIAHDFNNILSAIIGYTELAELEVPDSSPAKSYLHEVLKANKRAKNLIQHILSFSRKEAVARVPVQVALVAKEAIKLLRATIPTTVDIRDTIEPDCGVVMANPTQIHQVLINLCTNAAQAMEDQGGVILINAERTKVSEGRWLQAGEAGYLAFGDYVKLTVVDTGPGIDHLIIDRIFDPYFTTKDTGKGSGMGLAVVHGIVRSCGGAIEVESSPGKGARFEIYLPTTEGRQSAEAIREDNMESARGHEHIMMVDDEPALITLNKERLEKLGYAVTAVTDSTRAYELFAANPDYFDLVITDQTMPGLTGEQLTRRILAVRPDLPIILCTGYSSAITPEKAYSLGISEFIMKPVQYDVFAKAIRRALDGVAREEHHLDPQ